MSTGAVLVDRIGDDLALITLNRPDRLNAIDDSLVTGLHAALDRFESDAGVRAVVLPPRKYTRRTTAVAR